MLSEARRIARLAGASVYAVVVTPPLDTDELNALAGPVGEMGADKLLLCEAADFRAPPIDSTHGRGLDAAVERVRPLLVLFPSGGVGAALGPPLAARLAGTFAPWCDFLTSDAETPTPKGSGRVQLIRCRPDGRSGRRLDPLDIDRAIVATFGAGRLPVTSGNARDLEIEVVAVGQAPDPKPPLVETGFEPNPRSHLPLAPVLVLIGDDDDGRPLIPPDGLRAGAPPGVVVERACELSNAILADCCPEIVLKIGPSGARTARSPRTRVVLAAIAPAPTDPAVDDVDVLWTFPSRDDLTLATVANLIAEIGGAP